MAPPSVAADVPAGRDSRAAAPSAHPPSPIEIAAHNDPEVIRRVLEARSSACSHRRRGSPVYQLTRTLAELEMALDSMGAG